MNESVASPDGTFPSESGTVLLPDGTFASADDPLASVDASLARAHTSFAASDGSLDGSNGSLTSVAARLLEETAASERGRELLPDASRADLPCGDGPAG